MKKVAGLTLSLMLIGGSFVAGAWYSQHSRVAAATPGATQDLTYSCPMHPQYTSHRPGDCPICGMPLVSMPARADDPASMPADGAASPPTGAVVVDARFQQLGGVRVMEVAASSGTHSLRTLGRVVPDEARTYTVNAGIEGFVREVFPVTTGSQVKRGQPLATFSAPEAIQSIQAYIVALNAMDHLKQGGAEGPAQAQITSTSSNFQQRLEKLEDLGMSVRQIEEMEQTRLVPKSIRIVAPADGFVVARSISPGQRFGRGTEWYRIADLSRVWILADVSGVEADYVHPGMAVTVSLPDRHRAFHARVSDVSPQVDSATRTLKVRLEMDNPGYVLRPDMFVDVELAITLPTTIAIPADALVDSGLRKTVFVEHGSGVFEPRQVQTGWRFGEQVEIIEGLAPGDRIAASGTFLLDSESRLHQAAARVSHEPARSQPPVSARSLVRAKFTVEP